MVLVTGFTLELLREDGLVPPGPREPWKPPKPPRFLSAGCTEQHYARTQPPRSPTSEKEAEDWRFQEGKVVLAR